MTAKPPAENDPRGFELLAQDYLHSIQVRGYAPSTLTQRTRSLRLFVRWCAERELTRPADVTAKILEQYQRHLFAQRKANGQPLSFRSQSVELVALRRFFRWLAKSNFILFNPASGFELPRLGQRLPRAVLSVREVAAVLSQPDVSQLLGLRDRAVLETFYSTAMRRMELIGLAVWDMDLERGTVLIREGKGRRDRMVPIGERAIAWVERYLADVRPALEGPASDAVLYLTHTGRSFSPNRMSQLVRRHVLSAELSKHGSCHLLRHSAATHMLEGGADVRFIQVLLGHASLETTQLYTQVAIHKLKQVHRATHPGARLEGHQEPASTEAAARAIDPQAVRALLAALEREADDDDG